MINKPEGPIWIDLSEQLYCSASTQQLIQIANLAMNRLTMRDWSEIFREVGLQATLNFNETEQDNE